MISRAIILWIILLTIIMVVVAIVNGVKINQEPSKFLFSSKKIFFLKCIILVFEFNLKL